MFCTRSQSLICENGDACVSFQQWIVSWARRQLAALLGSASASIYLSPSTRLSICFSSSITFSLLFPQCFSWWMSAELSKVTCEIKRKAKHSSQQAPWGLKAIFYRLPNKSLYYLLHLVINYYNKETLFNKSVNYWCGTSQEMQQNWSKSTLNNVKLDQQHQAVNYHRK